MIDAAQVVLSDPSILKATVFTIAAISGQSLHAVKKWSEGEAWVLANIKRTAGAVVTNLMGIIGFVSTGALDGITAMGTIFALGLFMGFSADSAINKGAREQWSAAERANKTGG